MHVDRTRVERWSGYESALKESISNWTVSVLRTSFLPSGLIAGPKSIGPSADDRIKDVEVDAATQTPAVRVSAGPVFFAQTTDMRLLQASDLAPIAKQLHPHMTTVGSLLYTMRDHVNRADIPGHFWAATNPATMLELLQQVHQVLGESQYALRNIGRTPNTGEAGYFPEAASRELESCEGTACSLLPSECHRYVSGRL